MCLPNLSSQEGSTVGGFLQQWVENTQKFTDFLWRNEALERCMLKRKLACPVHMCVCTCTHMCTFVTVCAQGVCPSV